MEESGEAVPEAPAPAGEKKSNPPSPKFSPKKLVVRTLASRFNTRKNATPYPTKAQGPAKRSNLASMPENKQVRKKIAFEFFESFMAGKNGNLEQGPAGERRKVLNEPSLDDDTVMGAAPAEPLVEVQLPEGRNGPPVTVQSNEPGVDTAQPLPPEKMNVGGKVQHMGMEESWSGAQNTPGQVLEACAYTLLKEHTPKAPSNMQHIVTPFPVIFCNDSNLVARPLTEAEREVNSKFPPPLMGRPPTAGEDNELKLLSANMSVEGVERRTGLNLAEAADMGQAVGDLGAGAHSFPKGNNNKLFSKKQVLAYTFRETCSNTPIFEVSELSETEKSVNTVSLSLINERKKMMGGELEGNSQECVGALAGNREDGAPRNQPPTIIEKPTGNAGAEPTNSTVAPHTTENVWVKADHLRHPLVRSVAATSGDIRTSGPVAFDPKKVKELGSVGADKGTPFISFSSTDTEYLAKKLGHAIVGKFSHSIPSSHHIQKALGNIKFVGSFSWKHMNAKDIIMQFGDLTDYARMLNGPSGAPVWYVDSHPMRVFKWTPDFDPFFESPIAAVWCNLIGLPIHLYEHSAFFTIGSLLGIPMQADHATATRSRLSYARICVEIDISVPPPEEIMLDMPGKKVRQKVIWDRIPPYCSDCRHVGHVRDSCYAFGKKALLARKDYNLARNTKRQIWQPRQSKEDVLSSNAFASLASEEGIGRELHDSSNGDGNAQTAQPPNHRREHVDDDGFQRVVGRRGRKNQHKSCPGRDESTSGVTAMVAADEEKTEGEWRPPQNWEEKGQSNRQEK